MYKCVMYVTRGVVMHKVGVLQKTLGTLWCVAKNFRHSFATSCGGSAGDGAGGLWGDLPPGPVCGVLAMITC